VAEYSPAVGHVVGGFQEGRSSNILVEISVTSILILQVVNQVGSQSEGSDLRKAHDVVDDDKFASTMLDRISGFSPLD